MTSVVVGNLRLREWFHRDFESVWEKFQKENARSQGVLSLGPDGSELPLDEASSDEVHASPSFSRAQRFSVIATDAACAFSMMGDGCTCSLTSTRHQE